jgi:LysM repeat protein
MARRSPARFLAPLALVAVSVALYSVVTSNLSNDEESASPSPATDSRPTASPNGDGDGEEQATERKGPRRYTVKVGDTPSSIAEKTGIPLEDILRLNPDLDPQTLSPGQRLRLRK